MVESSKLPTPLYVHLEHVALERCEGNMLELHLPFLCEFGVKLGKLIEQKDDAKPIDLWWSVYAVVEPLNQLLLTFPLPVCSRKGQDLLSSLKEWNELAGQWGQAGREGGEHAERLLTELRLKFNTLSLHASDFRTVLMAELATLRAYLVLKKGIYATSDLIETAELTLPESVVSKLPQSVVVELREGGRCLAFECATASGFHVMRAVELVLHRYYVVCCKPSSRAKLPNWGAYLCEMKKCKEPAVLQVVALLQQIKDLERNVIMHPEAVLTPDDAFRLFELAKSAIIFMADSPKTSRTKGGTSASASAP